MKSMPVKIGWIIKIRHLILTLFTAAGLFLGGPAAATGYTALDLGADVEAKGINASGQVVGHVYLPRGGFHAFITGPNGAGMRDIHTGEGIYSTAYAINDAGRAVGVLSDLGGFITGPNGIGVTGLGTLGGFGSTAFGINNAGQVVGLSYKTVEDTSLSARRAFITGPNGAGMSDLGTLGGSAGVANSINATGQVAGYSWTADGFNHAFITGPEGMGMTDVGNRLSGVYSEARDINAAGQAVGFSSTNVGNWYAFMIDVKGVGITDLGSLGGNFSVANGINDGGQVVGFSSVPGDKSDHAFITGPNGADMTDLNSLVYLADGAVLTEAFRINNAGQVIADGYNPTDTRSHAYLLTPIPEPESYVLMLGGLGLIGLMARRRGNPA